MNDNNPEISVVLPAYIPDDRYLGYLYRAVSSLATQTYKNFELILILNDCSEEITEKISHLIKAMPFHTTTLHKPDRNGLGYVLKMSEPHLRGKYMARLDADDAYTPNKLKIQREWMEKHPNVDLCFTSSFELAGDKIVAPYFKPTQHNNHDDIVKALRGENVMTGPTVMFRTKKLMDIGGFEEGPIGMEDWGLWGKASRNGYRFAKIPDQLYLYSQHTSVPRKA